MTHTNTNHISNPCTYCRVICQKSAALSTFKKLHKECSQMSFSHSLINFPIPTGSTLLFSSLAILAFHFHALCSMLQMYDECVCAHKQLEFKATCHPAYMQSKSLSIFLCIFFLLPQTYLSLFSSHLSVCFFFFIIFSFVFFFHCLPICSLLSVVVGCFLLPSLSLSLSLTFPV